ncbi:hypothetical protein ACH4TP_06885 [Streptomyces sp. NPDC021012]|uniref:hypothetical protein n=1 Tax=Streptomyces sp. NPDC021012 TaxID=3365107 RepID=UPI003787C011
MIGQGVFVWLSVAAGAFVIAALASVLIGLTEAPDDPSLTVSDVQGVWSASDGGRLTARADGSAELEKVPDPGPGCGEADSRVHTGPANWVFDTFPDESPGIRLDYPGVATGQTCSVYLSISISDEYGTKGFLPHNADQWYVRGTTHPH